MHHNMEVASLIIGEFFKTSSSPCNSITANKYIPNTHQYQICLESYKYLQGHHQYNLGPHLTKGCFSDERELLLCRSTPTSLTALLEPWTKMNCDKYNNFKSLTPLHPCYRRKSFIGTGIFTATIPGVLPLLYLFIFKLFSSCRE